MQRPSGNLSRFYTIAIHILIWGGLFMIPFIDDNRHITPHFIWRNAILFVLLMAFYYFNTYFLIRKFYLPGRMLYYFLAIIGCLVLIASLNLLSLEILDNYISPDFHRPSHLHRFFFPVFPSLFVFAISTAIRITNEWFKAEKQKKEMENEKLNSELAFLKSQVNPHFLFNILNNICSLARKKSDHTEDAIIKLSQLMRYMLYESKDEKVSLEKEVEYLQNYIELQRLRISESVVIQFVINGKPETKVIEPMLLIPFVENAFKHGVSYLEDSQIDIRLDITNDHLQFHIENNMIRKSDDPVQQESGIGLKNVLRRLELIYPGQHSIRIDDRGTKYRVDLEIRFI
ncbi:MAG: histidine kinase [Bacteroidetes bacterium]|nr:histidine kinase [Bacteroidota bacterium]